MTSTQVELCFVDDDASFRENLAQALRQHGFSVRTFPDSRELYAGLLERPCRLMLIDLYLPGEDGMEVARRLKGMMDVGVVFLSARADAEKRAECMLELADAFLSKPVHVLELVATLISVHRRLLANLPGEPVGPVRWRLEGDGWTLIGPEGRTVTLTATERLLLRTLFAQVNNPVSRPELIRALGHDTDYYLDHRLDMVVSRLRRKVRETLGHELPLRALRGTGFVFSPTN
ncbi:MAG: response regulator transcription factor [Rhodocyclaceae bacterium]